MHSIKKSEVNSNLLFFNIPKKKGGVYMKNFIEIKIAEYPERTDQGLAWVVVYKIIYL